MKRRMFLKFLGIFSFLGIKAKKAYAQALRTVPWVKRNHNGLVLCINWADETDGQDEEGIPFLTGEVDKSKIIITGLLRNKDEQCWQRPKKLEFEKEKLPFISAGCNYAKICEIPVEAAQKIYDQLYLLGFNPSN